MDATKPTERQLRTEIKWMREALAIAELERENLTYDSIIDAQKETLPLEYRRFCDKPIQNLRDGIARLESDLKHLQRGDFE